MLHKLLAADIVESDGLVAGTADNPGFSRMEMNVVNHPLMGINLIPDFLGLDIPQNQLLILPPRRNQRGILIKPRRPDPMFVSDIRRLEFQSADIPYFQDFVVRA